MKDRFPTIMSVVILVALVIGTWVAAEHTKRAVVIEAAAKKTHEPDSWSKNFTVVRTNEAGLPISRLVGEYMEHFPDDGSYDITNPIATNVPNEGRVTQGTAKMATVLDEGNRIVLKGNAYVFRLPEKDDTDPMNVRSEEMTMLVDEDVAYTDLPAVARDGRTRLSGIGMRYNNKTGELSVKQSTDVEISPKKLENTTP
jgi:lipopolysaccharide export system protein LptC